VIDFDPTNHPHPPLQPADRRLGVGLAPSHPNAPGRDRWSGRPRRHAAAVRSNMLSLPRQRTRRGVRNPEYESTFVFTNDFAALLPTPRRPRLTTTPCCACRVKKAPAASSASRRATT